MALWSTLLVSLQRNGLVLRTWSTPACTVYRPPKDDRLIHYCLQPCTSDMCSSDLQTTNMVCFVESSAGYWSRRSHLQLQMHASGFTEAKVDIKTCMYDQLVFDAPLASTHCQTAEAWQRSKNLEAGHGTWSSSCNAQHMLQHMRCAIYPIDQTLLKKACDSHHVSDLPGGGQRRQTVSA